MHISLEWYCCNLHNLLLWLLGRLFDFSKEMDDGAFSLSFVLFFFCVSSSWHFTFGVSMFSFGLNFISFGLEFQCLVLKFYGSI